MSRQIHLLRAVALHRRPAPGFGLLDTSTTRMRVRPGDLDLYLHVNNGVYLQYMDIARTNLIADMGGFPALRHAGWYPVVAASTVSYRRSLRLGERFEVATRVLGWDPRVVYVEQSFLRGGERCARGLVAARFLARAGRERIAPHRVIAVLGAQAESPALPDDVTAWARAVDVAQRA